MSGSSDPCLSVIIACFNDGPMLREAVESAEQNRRGRHEVIVVDDGSSDPATLEVFAELEQRGIQVIHQKNAGPAAARNTGIRHARGRYILPLDADNRLRPAYIDHGIDILDAHPAVDVVYGDPEFFGARTGRVRVGEFKLQRMLVRNYIDTCAVFRRSAWERVGGYDEKIPVHGVEDWDFWIRVGCGDGLFHHVDEVLFEYRVRPGSLTTHMRQSDNFARAERYLRDKPIRLTIGQFKDAATWDYVVEALRAAPLRTCRQLVLRAFFPGLRAWLHRRLK